MSSKILLRRGTAAQWTSANPILGSGELGVETDTLKFKIGNGTSTWTQLTSYANITPSDLTSAINGLINAAPSALDTLNELAAAINNDSSFSTTVNNLLSGKVSKSGGDTITAATAATKGLIIQAATSQTANILETQDSSGVVQTRIAANGTLYATQLLVNRYITDYNNTTPYIDFNANKLTINARNASYVGLVVQAAASQTANLQEWQNSSGTVLSRIDSGGNLVVSTAYVSLLQNTTAGKTNLQTNQDTGAIGIYTSAAANKGLIIKGATSQTANLQEWQDSSGTALTYVAANGTITTPGIVSGANGLRSNAAMSVQIPVFTDSAQLAVSTGGAGYKGILVRGATSQTANLTEWQDSTPNTVAYINNGGGAWFSNSIGIGATPYAYSSMISISTSNVSNKGLVIRGIVSQTANLQEWQDSSGTVLTKVDANGIVTSTNGFITSASYKLANGIISLGYTNTYTTTIGVIAGTPTNETTLIVKKKDSTETGNLQEWQNSVGTAVTKIDSTGSLTVNGISLFGNADFKYSMGVGNIAPYTNSSMLAVSTQNGGTSALGILVRGMSGQTGDLQQWQDSSGTILAKVTAAGRLGINTTGTGYIDLGDATISKAPGSGFSFSSGISNIAYLGVQSNSGTNAIPVNIGLGNSGNAKVLIQGHSSQTANLTEWQDSSGNILAAVAANGRINAAQLGSTASGKAIITINGDSGGMVLSTAAVGNKGLILRGISNQTGNLFELQDVNGTVLSGANALAQTYIGSATPITYQVGGAVTGASGTGTTATITLSYAPNIAVGDLITVAGITPSGYNATNVLVTAVSNTSPFSVSYANTTTAAWTSGGTVSAPAQTSITARSAGTTGLVIKGAASQVANLQEWQNSSGTTYANITPGGSLVLGRGSAGTVGNSLLTIQAYTAQTYYSIDNTSTLYSRILFMRGNSGGTLMALASKGDTANGVAALAITNGAFTTELIGFGYNGNIYTNLQSASTVGLIIKAAASQTANLQEWQNSSGTVIARITNAGDIVGQSLTTNWGISQIAANSAVIGLIVKAAASQTANLQEWQDSSGTVLSNINANGWATFARINNNGLMSIGRAVDGNASLLIDTNLTTRVGIQVRAVASQSANLQEWQNSTGTAVARVAYSGYIAAEGIQTGSLSFTGITYNGISNPTGFTTLPTIIVKGIASQTADLQQWQNSAGTTKSKVTASGDFVGDWANLATIGLGTSSTYVDSVPLRVYSNGAGTIVSIIRGAASQTANLQEWQDSTGSALGYIASNGDMTFAAKLVGFKYGRFGTDTSYTNPVTLKVTSSSTATATVQIKAIASQIADLQQWQDSTGTVKSSINASGSLELNGKDIELMNIMGAF